MVVKIIDHNYKEVDKIVIPFALLVWLLPPQECEVNTSGMTRLLSKVRHACCGCFR